MKAFFSFSESVWNDENGLESNISEFLKNSNS